MKTCQLFQRMIAVGAACIAFALPADTAQAATAEAIALIEAQLPKNVPVEKADCPLFQNAVRKTVAASPDRAEEILLAALTAHPECACEIVQAVVLGITPEGGQADVDKVAALVKAAVKILPAAAADIGRCCEEVAPYAVESIRVAVAEELELNPNLVMGAPGFFGGSPGPDHESTPSQASGEGGEGGEAEVEIAKEDRTDRGFIPPVSPILPGN